MRVAAEPCAAAGLCRRAPASCAPEDVLSVPIEYWSLTRHVCAVAGATRGSALQCEIRIAGRRESHSRQLEL